MKERKGKIGILTSGGDAPGMNVAIRAVVRAAINNNVEVVGINKGYQGFFSRDFKEMTSKSVCDIINRGGTILKTARCKEMMSEEGQKHAASICNELGIDTLVVIGGDGSLTGGLKLNKLGINVIGIPGTIDLDLPCTEYTIGFDTAVNTAVTAIDKLRDTSYSHERCSILEVMGRDAGFIATWTAVAGGAENVLLPEEGKPEIDDLVDTIIQNRKFGKKHNLIVVAEGIGNSQELAKQIEEKTGFETRATILGHSQRGGTPTAVDRVHASMMGKKAIEYYLKGITNVIVIVKDGKYDCIDIQEGIEMEKPYDSEMADTVRLLGV